MVRPLYPACVGLANLGNTCYMNCILQCLSNSPVLPGFFDSGRYNQYVNIRNPRGSKGKISRSFGQVVQQLRGGMGYIYPKDFKKAVDKQWPDFEGDDQHDSIEFLNFMLDILHEDLNKNKDNVEYRRSSTATVLKNSEIEEENDLAEKRWFDLTQSDGSVINELFSGQFRTSYNCSKCYDRTVHFETFTYLQLPVNVDSNISITVYAMTASKSTYTMMTIK